ncbi:transcriptional regulator [Rhodomicrobium udaipurense JA643]|uniref:ROK family protein n=1 Tax=Rhodomicrobium udaipurense TaxID=1202716 RepID=A0A8I1GCM7_9HYPH|nr:ROK family protein [Rhodomicrobium udaipurense]KAI94344.1 transcriptional regulator [Rhodomicrobium udaipurense JA643]MBJ7543390.1 ROK family protein [Rhodomicrobium udaipurense]
MWRVGVDLGGTKIEALALSPEGKERARLRMATPRGDYEVTLDAIAALVARCVDGLPPPDIAGVGVGIPGSLSPATGLVRNANSTWLNGKPLHRDLQARLPWPCVVENDANCFALSEAADGAGAGYRTVFGVIIGTGVGGGIVIEGRSHLGLNALGGEWGHNALPWPDADEWPGEPCYCGKRGCIETFLSGPALQRQYAALSGETVAAKTISERAGAGEAAAIAALETYSRRLAKALASVVDILDPDVIVFGGGVSNIEAVITGAAHRLPDWAFSDSFATPLLKNRWGDSSGVRGAARLIILG